jgi:hypothetical protein
MTVAPILILLLSALLTWLTRNRHSRTQWIVASVLGIGVWAFTLLINFDQSAVMDLSIWQPEDLFQSPISLTIDSITWPLVYGTATVLLAVIFTAPSRPTSARASLRSFWFIYTSLTVFAIMSANLLTTALAWAMMDFCTLFFLVAIVGNRQDRRAVFVRAGVNAVSVLLIIAAAMASEIQGVVGLDLSSTGVVGIIMLAIAATLRLGIIPLHFALPPIPLLRKGVGTLLRLFPPVVALALLARVFQAGLPDVLRIVFYIAGSVGGLIGAIRWALQEEAVQARPFFVLSLASFGLLTATLTPEGSQVIVAVGILTLSAGAALSLFGQYTPSHRLVPIIVSVLLLGVPYTPGAVYATAIANPESFLIQPVLRSIALIITALLALGCFHLFFAVEEPWPIGESLARVMFNVGLVLPILAAVGVGIWRLQSDPMRSAFFSLAAAIIVGVLFLVFRQLSLEQTKKIRGLFQLFEPDRIYELLWTGLQRLLIGIRGLGELLEGPSGMLWLFVFVIVIVFIIQ